MVRSREVTHYNTGNDLDEGAGDKAPLNAKGNFERRPHHTPGPWQVVGKSAHIPRGSWHSVFEAFGGTEANARLIAAAPDMLAALIRVDSMCDALADAGYFNDTRRDTWREVREAISKAKGES